MGSPENYFYTKTHQWFDPSSGKVGITAFAAEALGEISFVDVDALEGAELTQVKMDGDEPASDPIDATVESSKAVGDIYSPVSGTVKEVNSDLMEKIDNLLEQNKVIARGLTLIHEMNSPQEENLVNKIKRM